MFKVAAFVLSATLLSCTSILARETGEERNDYRLWLRDPAISPDGARIAFRFRGQIWTVAVAGGAATALTPSGSHAGLPVWSPDGQTLAFGSDRFGAFNIFSMPVSGGTAQRLTWYALDERPMSFTPDGHSVLFESRRLGDVTRTFAPPGLSELSSQVYAVPAGGGRETLVLPNAALDVQWNTDGRRLVYTSANIEQPHRQHQVSRAVRQIWLYDAATGRHDRLTDGLRESRKPVWLPDGDIAYLSEASGSLNIWHLSLASRESRQVTHFTDGPVRSLTASRDGDLAFARDGRLYRLGRDAAEPELVAVTLAEATFAGEVTSRTSEFDDLVVAPNGQEIALVAHGDLYVTARDGRSVKRITHTPGEERSPTFSPDGKRLAYAAERDGHWSLYEASLADAEERGFAQATQLVERRLTTQGTDAFLPRFAPDGRHIAYVVDRAAVRILDLAAGSDRALTQPGHFYAYRDWSWWLSWSPDSRWLAFPVQIGRGFTDNVAVAPADGTQLPVRVAPAGEDQGEAKWSADGGFLIWRSDAEALRGAYQAARPSDIDAIFSSRRAKEAFEARLRVPAVADPEPQGQRSPGTPTLVPRAADQAGMETTAPRDEPKSKSRRPEPLPFETDGIEDRQFRLSQAPGNLVYAGLLADGVSILTVEQSLNPRGDGYTVTGTVRDLRLERQRTLFSGVGYKLHSPVLMSRDQRYLYFLDRSGFDEVELTRGTWRSVRVEADDTQDPSASRREAFEQFWRLTKQRFLDPAMHGVDWDGVHTNYAQFLPSLGDSRDLAELLSEMAGELDASHTRAFLTPRIPAGEETASLGLYYDETFSGPGMRVTAILSGGPFDAAGTRLAPGDVLVAIDGETIPKEGGVRRLLRGRKDKLVEVAFRKPDGTDVHERRALISLERERNLAFDRWRRARRDAVTVRSCGQLGYVHVRAMDAASYRRTFAEVFGRFGEAQGLIVDVRFNGGGNLHNQLLTMLSGRPYLTFDPRTGPKQSEPRDRWTKSSAVLVNGASYSDAAVFPQAYRGLGIGPIVGDPIAGTGTFVWWMSSQIIPGLTYGLPQVALRDLDGHVLENTDIVPDVAVASDPAAWAEGQDPQLDAAIDRLLGTNTSCHASKPSDARVTRDDNTTNKLLH